ncbi:MAG: signal peptide peptidase SppA [Candidatus Pacebacteria bacterium]|nr:signal peptide peptidase SppA [Candidatus Paceibacterota bacterium]
MGETPLSIGSQSAMNPNVQSRYSALLRAVIATTAAIFVGLPAFFFWCVAVLALLVVASAFGEEETYCSVARIPLTGIVTTTNDGFTRVLEYGTLSSADDFVASVQWAEEDPTIDALLIEIDSPGGTPVAADEMLAALLNTRKPVVAVVREMGASAAYWVAAGADYIVASPVSDVGSIGVTMSYLETASSTESEGSRWVDLSSGAYKDAGHPERSLRFEEQAYFKSQVESVHHYMVQRIAEARPVLSLEEVTALADGRAYVGTEALRLKLVDALGSFNEALAWVGETVGKNTDEVVLCDTYESGLEALF